MTLTLIKNIRITWRILYVQNTREELRDLVNWALNRKRSFRLAEIYGIKLRRIEEKSRMLKERHKGLYFCATVLRFISDLVSVNPQYKPGMAKRYRAGRV